MSALESSDPDDIYEALTFGEGPSEKYLEPLNRTNPDSDEIYIRALSSLLLRKKVKRETALDKINSYVVRMQK